MRHTGVFTALSLAVLLSSTAWADSAPPPVLNARIVATGLPGAAAVSQVGYFHPGGPIRDKPAFAATTEPGQILAPDRVLVATISNYGAPLARANEPEGSVLSIDPAGAEVIVVPPAFGAAGDQASALSGRVRLLTAQSPAFRNGVTTPKAVTADLPAATNPLGISINNAFGRIWVANAPFGSAEAGTESIIDPGGMPLAGAPNQKAGGVFAGNQTGRATPMIEGGLRTGAVGTTLLGMSPDGSKRAVFAILTADGAIAQAHTEQGIDGLAPPGTIAPIPLSPPTQAADALATRAGVLFNWVPDRIVYVSDPIRNAVVAVKLSDDGQIFRVDAITRFALPEMNTPIDLAPAVPEVANPGFASNTMLAGASDIYVLNRGDSTILRMTQTGRVVAVRRVSVDGAVLGPKRLNGIAVSRDAKRLWLTVSGPLAGHANNPGALIEVEAFGAARAASIAPPMSPLAERGASLFATRFTPETGLGPLYDETSCKDCHSTPVLGGMGPGGIGLVARIGRFENGRFDPMIGRGGPVAHRHVAGESCGLRAGMPPDANLVSIRNSPSLFGAAVLDAIPDEAIRAMAQTQAAASLTTSGHPVGRPNVVKDAAGKERIGRLGWKAQGASLKQFVADAMRNEMGLTNPLAPTDPEPIPATCEVKASPRDDGTILAAMTAFIEALPAPSVGAAIEGKGADLFASIGCAQCHTPVFKTGTADIPLYSDLLLHDLGPALNDGMVQGAAAGHDWRTTPLWDLGSRVRFLHDGRATSTQAAIGAHDGEAAPAARAFRGLPVEQQASLLLFLSSL